jgi:uncharacterized peroxidase-related enzyme
LWHKEEIVAFIDTVSHEEAEGQVRELYDADLKRLGYIANYTKAFSHRPEVYQAWQRLNAAIKANMDLRHYELATLAAAQTLHSSYCCLAHGKVALQFFSEDDLVKVMAGHEDGVTPAERALMAFAKKVTLHASEVTQEDIDTLRTHDFSDAAILDIVLAASARNFFSRVLDGVGTLPDAAYGNLNEKLREALTVGRPISPL